MYTALSPIAAHSSSIHILNNVSFLSISIIMCKSCIVLEKYTYSLKDVHVRKSVHSNYYIPFLISCQF